MSGLINSVVEIGSFGLVKDVTGVEASQDAALDAAQYQADAGDEGVRETQRQFNVSQENLAPYLEAGSAALNQQSNLLGLNGTQAQENAYSQFTSSPGQQFLQERAQKNLLANAAAIGGLGGGNVQSALVEQGVGFAQQDYQNQFNNLAALAGNGQTATTTSANLGANASSAISSGIADSAAARASGVLGSASVNQQFNSQLLGAAGTLGGAYIGTL